MIGLALLSRVPTKVWVFALAGVILTTIISLGYVHYSNLIDEVSTLRANESKYELAVKLQEKKIEKLEGVAEDWKKHTDQLIDTVANLQKKSVEAGSETRRLDELFAEHDLSRLAFARPAAIERRVNRATAELGRLFECTTSEAGCESGTTERSAP